MTVRTSMENRSRVELTFSFDNEQEANQWLALFKEASKVYDSQQNTKAAPNSSEANSPVPKPSGGGSMEVPTPKPKAKK